MSDRQLTGTRIRNRRLDQGLRQAEVARAVGISPSYLNLIEHNRRRIGGKLLHDLARELDIDPQILAEGSGPSLLDPLREAAAAFSDIDAEIDRAEDLAARFPGWTALIAAQQQQIIALQARVRGLVDRLSHDPRIATSLHEVLSTAAAIRSTASILVESRDLDVDWRERFHRNIDSDSRRLAESSRALMEHLDLSGDGGEALTSPLEEAEQFLDAAEHHFKGLEDDSATPESLVAPLQNSLARQIAGDRLRQLAKDARALPFDDFTEAARLAGYDPFGLAQAFSVPLSTAMRRLAVLPRSDGHPELGLAVCDGAGVVIYHRPALGFDLPRAGAGCPLWPLYRALAAPGVPLQRRVSLPGRAGPQRLFDCTAIAEPAEPAGPNLPPRLLSTMLVRSVAVEAETLTDKGPAPDPVGPGCRVCPRTGCAARRHPSILPKSNDAPL